MEKLYEQICAAVREAGTIVLQATAEGKNVREKTSRHDLVTAYDARVQRFLQERLLALLPEAGFLGEEDGGRLESASAWRFIVDPIDGTMNFIRTLRRSCISVGLAQGERMEFGAVYDPYHDELFTAVRGAGAFLNGAPIHVSDCDMAHALVYIGSSPYYPDCIPQTFALAQKLTETCSDIRRSGSAALELCDVACGRVEAYFEYRLSPWDYAAGSLIVTEAGGKISALNGEALRFDQKCSVAAANALCHAPLLQMAEQAQQQTSQN